MANINFQNISPIQSYEQEIVNIILTFPTDSLLTDYMKNKLISQVRAKDNGIIGAYQMYLADQDIEGFKSRLIHRALSPYLNDISSRATTAQFNRNRNI